MRDERHICWTNGRTAAISGLSCGGWAMAAVVAAVQQWQNNNQLKKYGAVAAKGESKGKGNGGKNNRGSSNSSSGSGSGSQGREQG